MKFEAVARQLWDTGVLTSRLMVFIVAAVLRCRGLQVITLLFVAFLVGYMLF